MIEFNAAAFVFYSLSLIAFGAVLTGVIVGMLSRMSVKADEDAAFEDGWQAGVKDGQG